MIPESKVESGRNEIIEKAERHHGRHDDLVRVKSLTVFVNKPGSAGPSGTMGHWNFQVVDGEVHRPEEWGEAPKPVVEMTQDELKRYQHTAGDR